MMLTDPLFYLVAIPAVLIFGIGKGGFGGAIGIMSVPLMSLAIPPATAAAILLPILCCMDLINLRYFRGQWDSANLKILLPAALVGVALGTVVFKYLPESYLRILIGLIVIGFTLKYWFGAKTTEASPLDPAKGSFWGAVSGFTSFSIHAGGPPLSIYLLPQRLDKTVFVATTTVFFSVVNFAKLAPYAWLGQFSQENLLMTLILLPLAPVGTYLGYYLHRRVDQQHFYRFIYLFVFLAGLKLLYNGTIAVMN